MDSSTPMILTPVAVGLGKQLTSLPSLAVLSPMASTEEELSTVILDKYLDPSFLAEMVSQLFFQDFRVYSPVLELCKAIMRYGSNEIRSSIGELLASITLERLFCYQHHQREVLITERTLRPCDSSSFLSTPSLMLTSSPGGHDFNAIELIDFVLAVTITFHTHKAVDHHHHHYNRPTLLHLLSNLSLTLLNILQCNHTMLSVDRKGSMFCPISAILRSIQTFLEVLKTISANDLLRDFVRHLLLSWPIENEELVKSYINVMEVLLLTLNDPPSFLLSSQSSTSSSTLFAASSIPSLSSSSLNRCILKIVTAVSSPHYRVLSAALSLLRRNNVLHQWILPFSPFPPPLSSSSSSISATIYPPSYVIPFLAAEQRVREVRLEDLVDRLRHNRRNHWCQEVREECGFFLDELLDHLSY